MKSMTLLMTPLLLDIESMNPSHADCSSLTEPLTVLSRSSAMRFSSPSTSSRLSRSSCVASAPWRKVLKAETLRLSVSSSVVARSMPSAFSCFSPASSSGSVSADPPRDLASLPFASARLSRMLRVAVPALDASNPALESDPSRATVSSMLKPKVLATGPTMDIASLRYSKLSALLLAATAHIERTSSVSPDCRPKMRRAAPANEAAEGRSAPIAVAKWRMGSCIAWICASSKPSFASSVCSIVTCEAVYSVVRPRACADCVRSFISSALLPSIVARSAFACSKSAMVPKASAPNRIMPVTTFLTALAAAIIPDPSSPTFVTILPTFELPDFSCFNLPLTLESSLLSSFHSLVPGAVIRSTEDSSLLLFVSSLMVIWLVLRVESCWESASLFLLMEVVSASICERFSFAAAELAPSAFSTLLSSFCRCFSCAVSSRIPVSRSRIRFRASEECTLILTLRSSDFSLAISCRLFTAQK